MSLADALAKVRTTRPQAQPNDAFMKQLELYNTQLIKDRAEDGAGPRPVSPKLGPKPTTPRVAKGPQLPPHLQHLMKGGEDEEEEEEEEGEETKAAMKGPQLPPHLQAGGKDEEKEDAEEEATGAVKGPQLPPHLQHLLQRGDSEEQSPVKKAKHE